MKTLNELITQVYKTRDSLIEEAETRCEHQIRDLKAGMAELDKVMCLVGDFVKPIDVDYPEAYIRPKLDLDQSIPGFLVRFRKALGCRIKIVYMCPKDSYGDSKKPEDKDMVRVFVGCEKFKLIHFMYEKRLSPNDKCHIEETIRKPQVDRRLVCTK